MITEEQLKEWEEIEKKATSGPWWDVHPYAENEPAKLCLQYRRDGDLNATREDWKFIEVARTAMPLLLQAYREQQTNAEHFKAHVELSFKGLQQTIEEQQKEIDRLKKEYERLESYIQGCLV